MSSANLQLSPLSFLRRASQFFAEKLAIVHGDTRLTYGEFGDRVARLAQALSDAGIGPADTVSILAPNIPAMLEAHFSVPILGARLNPINYALGPEIIGEFLRSSDCKLLLCDGEYLRLGEKAVRHAGGEITIICISQNGAVQLSDNRLLDYETLIAKSYPIGEGRQPESEFQPLALLYTSGTTGSPKAIEYTHRGCYVAALNTALSFGLSPDTQFLWSWPMFHSNGLSFIWAVTAVGGTHFCARTIDSRSIGQALEQHRFSHFCAAPMVLNLLANDRAFPQLDAHRRVYCITGGSPPPAIVLKTLERRGLTVVHQYGSSECHGAVTMVYPNVDRQSLPDAERYQMEARQGVPLSAIDDLRVAKTGSTEPVPRDGNSLGEIIIRSHAIAQLPESERLDIDEVTAKEWFRTGDIAVWYSDGTIEIRDRAKDMIISGGENISSIEIEGVLFEHPEVHEAAVVAKPHPTLLQTPCAFVDRVSGSSVSAAELEQHCRDNLPHIKVPSHFVFRTLPKTETGKIQKQMLRDIIQNELSV